MILALNSNNSKNDPGAEAAVFEVAEIVLSDRGTYSNSLSELQLDWTDLVVQKGELSTLQVSLGSRAGLNDIRDWEDVDPSSTAHVLRSLNLTAGQIVFGNIRAKSVEGLMSDLFSTDGIIVRESTGAYAASGSYGDQNSMGINGFVHYCNEDTCSQLSSTTSQKAAENPVEPGAWIDTASGFQYCRQASCQSLGNTFVSSSNMSTDLAGTEMWTQNTSRRPVYCTNTSCIEIEHDLSRTHFSHANPLGGGAWYSSSTSTGIFSGLLHITYCSKESCNQIASIDYSDSNGRGVVGTNGTVFVFAKNDGSGAWIQPTSPAGSLDASLSYCTQSECIPIDGVGTRLYSGRISYWTGSAGGQVMKDSFSDRLWISSSMLSLCTDHRCIEIPNTHVDDVRDRKLLGVDSQQSAVWVGRYLGNPGISVDYCTPQGCTTIETGLGQVPNHEKASGYSAGNAVESGLWLYSGYGNGPMEKEYKIYYCSRSACTIIDTQSRDLRMFSNPVASGVWVGGGESGDELKAKYCTPSSCQELGGASNDLQFFVSPQTAK